MRFLNLHVTSHNYIARVRRCDSEKCTEKRFWNFSSGCLISVESDLPSWTIEIHAWPISSRTNNCKKYMLATCRQLFQFFCFHGSYMRIIPQHVSGHVRDTCMKILGIIKCKCYMLVTCRKCFRNNNVSFSSTMALSPFSSAGVSLSCRWRIGRSGSKFRIEDTDSSVSIEKRSPSEV